MLGRMEIEMKLSDYFQRIVCINLDRRIDRWAECIEEAERNRMVVERFSGFDHPTNGHAGCTRSHRILLRQIAEGPDERVLVLEDDFAAVTRARLAISGFKTTQSVWKTHCSVLDGQGDLNQRFNCLIPFLPEKWDVLYLGAGYGEAPISRHNKHVIRCGSMKTTGSYGITRDFARKWTEIVDAQTGGSLENHPGCIDDVFGAMAKDHLFYVLQPRLIFQRKSLSDITGEENSYLYSMSDPTHENLV